MVKLVLLIVPFFAQFLNLKSQPGYLINSAKIEFVFANGFQKGTRTLIFKDSGYTAMEEIVTYTDTSLVLPDMLRNLLGKKIISHLLVIETRDSVFHIDLDASIGNRIQRYYLSGDSGIPFGAKKIGTDTFLGRKCDIFDFNGFKLWFWKGLILKREYLTPEGGKIYDYATNVDENYEAENDAFHIPNGIKMQ